MTSRERYVKEKAFERYVRETQTYAQTQRQCDALDVPYKDVFVVPTCHEE